MKAAPKNPGTGNQPTVARGELWAVDFEPQRHREEPGKIGRPALVIQTDALNRAGHASTIIIPGTSQVSTKAEPDMFPLRVRVPPDPGTGLRQPTDLLVDQARAVSNRRLLKRLGVVDAASLARSEQALRWLIGP